MYHYYGKEFHSLDTLFQTLNHEKQQNLAIPNLKKTKKFD